MILREHPVRARTAGALAVALGLTGMAQAKVYDADALLRQKGLAKVSAAAMTKELEGIAASLKTGDALILPSSFEIQDADFTAIPSGVEISGGRAGRIYLGGHHENMAILGTGVQFQVGPAKTLAKSSAAAGPAGLYNSVASEGAALSGGPFDNTYMFFQQTFGSHVINGMKNSVILYFDYEVANCPGGQNAKDPKVKITGDCSNSRIYHMVETNYCLKVPSVVLDGVIGPLTFLVGDTERGWYTLYDIGNSSKILLGGHRMMATNNATSTDPTQHPTISVYFHGGQDNMTVMSQDIGSPSAASLSAMTEKNFQVWGGFWEYKALLEADALRVFHTPNGYGPSRTLSSGFHEPAEVQDEVIFNYQGTDLTDPANTSKANPPKPPLLPKTDFPADKLAKIANPQYLLKSNYGAEVLAAGADPTGRKSSDAAFAQVLASKGKLEIPAGTYRIDKTLELYGDAYLSGQGMGRTTIRMTRKDIPAVKLVTRPAPLAKADSTVQPGVKPFNGLSDASIEGGSVGIDLTCHYYAGKLFKNIVLKNQTVAGIQAGDGQFGKVAVAEGSPCGPHEFDQNKFVNITFDHTGDYGIYNNMGMIDKGFLFNDTFIGQKKAGYAANFTTMFNTSIIQCTFQDIDGPGLDMRPGYTDQSQFGAGAAGYTPNNTMIESCKFIECGNDSTPAVDYNWCESQSISNTTITIKNKRWKWGYKGTAQIMTDVNIDVDPAKMVAGGAAIALRNTRQVRNARPTGNILRNVTSQGPIAFINDAPAAYSMDTYFPNHYDGYAWAYPQLLVDCQFSNAKYLYTLVQVSKTGAVTKEVQITPCADCQTNVGLKAYQPAFAGEQVLHVFDATGREITRLPYSRYRESGLSLPKGLYFGRLGNSGARMKLPVY